MSLYLIYLSYTFIYLFIIFRHPPSAIRHPSSAAVRFLFTDFPQPRTQACSRYPSDQRRLGTERDSARLPRRIFPFPDKLDRGRLGTRLTFPDLRSFPYQSFMATAEHGHISDTCKGVIITLVDRRGNLVDIILYNDIRL